MLPVPTIRGFDARAPQEERTSRVSNVVSFMAALGGGQQAAFMFDPADRQRNDPGVARRETERKAREARMSSIGGMPGGVMGLSRLSRCSFAVDRSRANTGTAALSQPPLSDGVVGERGRSSSSG